jgi:hypothetical protein
LTPGVYFTNILQAAFSFESLCTAFMCLRFGFVIFWRKAFGAKAAHKILAKLTPGVNFTNILLAAFLYKSFCAALMCLQFGFVIFWRKDFSTKAAHIMLVKFTPGVLVLHVGVDFGSFQE